MKVQWLSRHVDERSFSGDDFKRYGIDHDGIVFHSGNNWTVIISQEVFAFLLSIGEPVTSLEKPKESEGKEDEENTEGKKIKR